MHSSAVLRALPALPPRADWSKKIPLATFNIVNRLSSYGGNNSGKRTNVVDPALADEIVHGLDIAQGTHVVEAYPGMGVLTRAFLKQPPSLVTKVTAIEPASAFRKYCLGSQEPEEFSTREERMGKAWRTLNAGSHTSSLRSDAQARSDLIPAFDLETRPMLEEDEDADDAMDQTLSLLHPESTMTPGNKTISLLDQLKSEAIEPGGKTPPIHQLSPTRTTEPKRSAGDDRPPDMLTIWSSLSDPRLKIVDDTIYDWATFSKLDQIGAFQDVQAKEWNEDCPNIRFVAQIPESDLGEQLVAQWIGCMANQSWFFKYGRVQVSLIVRPTLYDRLTAVPGTKAYCKLSVMRAALCDYTPAAASYLDLNVEDTMSEVQLLRLKRLSRDKLVPRSLALVGDSKPGAGTVKVKGTSFGRSRMRDLFADYPDFGPLLSIPEHATDALITKEEQSSLDDCYYPKPKRTKREGGRPGMMALTLRPKKTRWIDKHSKDVWDYVLRRMFVMQGSTLEVAIKNLGLGATNLLPQLTGDKLPEERKIDATKLVREFRLQDWSNIVRAFSNWKFAPDVLLLGSVTQAEEGSSRMLGSGM